MLYYCTFTSRINAQVALSIRENFRLCELFERHYDTSYYNTCDIISLYTLVCIRTQ